MNKINQIQDSIKIFFEKLSKIWISRKLNLRNKLQITKKNITNFINYEFRDKKEIISFKKQHSIIFKKNFEDKENIKAFSLNNKKNFILMEINK